MHGWWWGDADDDDDDDHHDDDDNNDDDTIIMYATSTLSLYPVKPHSLGPGLVGLVDLVALVGFCICLLGQHVALDRNCPKLFLKQRKKTWDVWGDAQVTEKNVKSH